MADIFDTPYGESGRRGCDSFTGSSAGSHSP